MLGLDLVEIERVRKAAANPRFTARIFTESERAYARDKSETLAGMFAAKEAAVKALGTGFAGIRFTDIEVLHHPSGQPYLRMHGRAAELAQGRRVQLSVTHSRTTAAAVVLIEDTL